MCTYCMIADHAQKWWPDGPFRPSPIWPQQQDPLPPPLVYPRPWTREQLVEFEDLLKRVKALEDKVDPCPCPDASKLDFLKAIKERLDAIDDKLKPSP